VKSYQKREATDLLDDGETKGMRKEPNVWSFLSMFFRTGESAERQKE